MQRYILGRFAQALLCIIGLTMIVFMLIRLSGDPVSMMLPLEATREEYEAMKIQLGLDRPIYIQYVNFISGIAKGDFGTSIRFQKPCLEMFMLKFPNTLQLALTSMAIAVFLGVPVGILSAVKFGTWFDNFGKIFALLGQAMPVFWVGLMLIVIFGVQLRLLPPAGMGNWTHLVMPAFTLGWFFTAALLRLTRSAMLDVLDSEYIKMARIKGVRERGVILRHAFKNAAIPVVTLGALNFIFLLNGTVITETVFAWPGVGRLVVDSIYARDYPMIQTCVLIASFLFVFTNLFVDILYAYLDPRIRYQ
jgi:peptide/nickel transport system permease protein